MLAIQLPFAFATPYANIVQITSDTAVELKAFDTTAVTNVTLKQGSNFQQMNVDTTDTILTLSMAPEAQVTLTTPNGVAMIITPAIATGMQLSYPCDTRVATITTTDVVTVQVKALAAGPGTCTPVASAVSSGGGSGGGFTATPVVQSTPVTTQPTSSAAPEAPGTTSTTQPQNSFVAIPPTCFPDTGRNAFGANVCDLKQRGVIAGYDDGTFRPDANINRAEFVHLFIKTYHAYRPESASGATMNASCFADVATDAWYAKDVCEAKELGVITGYTPTEFGPDRPIVFAEALAIFLRARGDTIPPVKNMSFWFEPYTVYIRTKESDDVLTKTQALHMLTRAETAHMLVLLFPIAY